MLALNDSNWALFMVNEKEALPPRSYWARPGTMVEVCVAVSTASGQLPARNTFAWTVLTALADDVEAELSDDGTLSITLHKQRALGAT